MQRRAVKLGQEVKRPFVHTVGHEEHFNAFFAKHFQLRAAFGSGERVGSDVVDGFLPFFHAGFVIGQAHAGAVGGGAGKAQQFGNALGVGMVFAQTFFEHCAKFGVKLGVVRGGAFLRVASVIAAGCGCIGSFALFFGHVFKHSQHTAGVAFAYGFDIAAFLQNLAAYVQRQVRGINHAFDKTQILRQQCLCIVHDKDAADVELQAAFAVALVQVKRCFGRDVEQLGVFGVAFYLVVAPCQRVAVVVRDLLVKGFVLLGRDVFFGAAPQGIGLIDLLPFVGAHHLARLFVFALFPFFFGHINRQADTV